MCGRELEPMGEKWEERPIKIILTEKADSGSQFLIRNHSDFIEFKFEFQNSDQQLCFQRYPDRNMIFPPQNSD